MEAILGEHRRILAGAGHDVRLVAGRGEATLVPELDSRHPDVEALYQTLQRGEPDLGAFRALRDRISEQLEPVLADRDLVIAHNVATMPFNLPLAAALRESPRPVLHWVHDLAWLNDRYLDFRREGEPYDLLHEAQPGASYVAVSEVRGRELEGLLKVAAEVVPDGIDFDHFAGVRPATRSLLREAGLEGADPLVLVPLRVTRRKRLELAIKAAGELRSRYPELKVAVSGPLGPHSGENRAYQAGLLELRGRLALDDVVRFLHELARPGEPHPVDDATMAELYRLADVVLLPSESEGFGLPVLEAAAVRAPVACSDIEVLTEVGGDGLYTFAADGGEAAVASALDAALSSPAARDRRRVATTYAWDRILPRLEAVVEKAIA